MDLNTVISYANGLKVENTFSKPALEFLDVLW